MALRRILFTVAVGASGVVSLSSSDAREDPRPDLKDWKETKADEKAEADTAVATQKKKAAIGKAVELLESLQSKVLAEGEAEAKTYNKFACFCKDTLSDKTAAIQQGEDAKVSLSADITETASKREGLDSKIAALEGEVTQAEQDMKAATQKRDAAMQLYELNSKDLAGAVEALEAALQRLKASKSPSLAQLPTKSQDNVRQAVQLADALGLSGSKDKAATALLQAKPEVQMEDYDFKSDSIISMLEKLLDQFRAEKTSVEGEEVADVKAHDSFMQEKRWAVKMKTQEIEESRKAKAKAAADIGSLNGELSTVEANLKDDKAYATELSQMCSDKARTWDQRSALRAAELSTLTQALSMIGGVVGTKVSANTLRFAQGGATLREAEALAKNSAAMGAIEAEAEAVEGPALVQIRRVTLSEGRSPTSPSASASEGSAPGRLAILDMLRAQSSQLHSTLLASLVSTLEKDPFAKVKQIIQELIERLLQEANNEANHKGWCDKSLQAASQKRDYAAKEVRSLNSELAGLEARHDQLSFALKDLAKAIGEITDAQTQATKERGEEKRQNQATIDEANEGLDALNMVIDLLDKFYKTAAKEQVDLSLAQKGPADDAPDAGFEVSEAYTGAQAESGGILAMLDVMKSDFSRTAQETQVAEKQAQEDYLGFMTQSGRSLAEKKEANKERTEQFQDTVMKLGEANESLQAQTSLLTTAVKELIELQPVCVNTGMKYQDRVALREEEIAALNKASCILEKYQEYGPGGAADACN